MSVSISRLDQRKRVGISAEGSDRPSSCGLSVTSSGMAAFWPLFPTYFTFVVHSCLYVLRLCLIHRRWLTEGKVPQRTTPHSHHLHHHHHRHWLDSPTWALVFLRSFCQLKYQAIASSDFATRVFSRVGSSALEGRCFLSGLSPWLVPILKREDLAFYACMT
jgi:hypothetical protein